MFKLDKNNSKSLIFSPPCRRTVGSVNDSQMSASITISMETAPSTHQNQVCAPVPASYE